jgi:hypothetical protein
MAGEGVATHREWVEEEVEGKMELMGECHWSYMEGCSPLVLKLEF